MPVAHENNPGSDMTRTSAPSSIPVVACANLVALLVLTFSSNCGNAGDADDRGADDLTVETIDTPDSRLPLGDLAQSDAREEDVPLDGITPDSLLDLSAPEDSGRALVDSADQVDDVETTEECEQACAHMECGIVDSCFCGACPPDHLCSSENVCEEEENVDHCAKLCDFLGWACGEAEPGCICGTCAQDDICALGIECIQDPCPEACAGKECGVVGAWYIGLSCICGMCPEGNKCDYWTFTCTCTPQCSDPVAGAVYECGDDGCGGSCGECPPEAQCDEQHQCQPE